MDVSILRISTCEIQKMINVEVRKNWGLIF